MTDDAIPYHVDRIDDPTRDPTRAPWPGPTEAMLASPQFDAVWQCIRTWDVAVPDAYTGSCGATGNHVRAILDALAPFLVRLDQVTLRPDPASVLVVTLPAGQTDDSYDQIAASLREVFKVGPAWEHVRIPILFLEDGIKIEQVDEASMRRAGWVRQAPTADARPGPQEDGAA